jgi:hypothetical protein
MDAEPSPELLKLSFDQYQRYRDVRETLHIIKERLGSGRLEILEVGGCSFVGRDKEDFLISAFMPEDKVIVVDLPPVHQDNYLQGQGTALPFGNGTFDVVVSTDTLEHVPVPERRTFVHELLRVAKFYVILTGPFAHPHSQLAEQIVYDFFRQAVGIEHRWLKEHLDNGLPDLDECLSWIADSSLSYVVFPSGYVYHWLPMMLIQGYLSTFPENPHLNSTFNTIYNFSFFESDHQQPGYRQVVVVSKENDDRTLDKVKARFVQMKQQNTHFELAFLLSMLQPLTESRRELATKNEEIARLRDRIRRYEQRRLFKILSKIDALRRKISSIM